MARPHRQWLITDWRGITPCHEMSCAMTSEFGDYCDSTRLPVAGLPPTNVSTHHSATRPKSMMAIGGIVRGE